MALPTAAAIFDRHLRPLYPPDLRDDAALLAARASHLADDETPEIPDVPRPSRRIAEGAERFVDLARALFDRDLTLDYTDASIHRLAAALDRERRDRWIAASTPGAPDDALALFAVHAAFYVGECIARNHGGAWSIRRPLWESVVRLTSRAGEATLAPFHWILKSLADDEIDRGMLAARHRQYVERATFDPKTLPPLVTARVDRAIPTLKIVRYDTLHKHLRAHLPELKDLGRDFPSPEQFAAMGFLELSMILLGEGRMVLMHGRAKNGVHLFWLDHGGFSHAAFFPASAGDPYEVAIEGDTLRLSLVLEGKRLVHELLWWG